MKVKLTQRETDVAKYLVEGKSNYEIAQILELSIHMVKIHVANMLKKFGINNRTQLAYILGKNNII
ncbi:response regulator transcription factor [bacterium]|nr:response regulator transcription factor [bacterium]